MTSKTNLTKIHRKSRRNRPELSRSKICGCFYCLKEFAFSQIGEWIVDNETALCPYCGVDAVLGFDRERADQQLLQKMHERWFEKPVRMTPEEWDGAIERNVWPAGPVKAPTRK